ncbi:ABC transporter ATP-binding protein [Photobacterium angustum]|uniref:ABC transporter ATP-binding protein n=1 Tax=Photobacterium angustum TaxID=661 RepID=A0A855SMZ6_PHOAN|nr:ABC transporter ATP-binding protein [Photobacterium angustum]KJF82426.1 multidrug ABC transporter ATP-binding protein [Photobacterium damselae subsp. damselae]KJG41803.1 multidrug ABC transporter ATP-binding protein [Photobacterium angustum]KJG46410.1 multidrug ABC transporter ATP-binding protein [Photobacterium angustum]KJG50547.1 multidrug ABC transporter ATP-binding protein [Photobacterium angustum]KJG54417.1 multidrug ABC transporter ATP-binding protein [Photobacterium angustum]
MNKSHVDLTFISAQHISKAYQNNEVLSDVSFELKSGQVLGLLGHNGAGKSTLIKAMLGMHSHSGELTIFGLEPQKQRAKIVERLGYISDVAVLPEWMTVKQVMKYVQGVHPRYDQQKMTAYLAQTNISLKSKIAALSKGMKVQLHLALVMSTDVNVLILDEPTLGLDLMYRETFYRYLMEWFHEGERALIIASHEVDEIAHMLTDVLVLKEGRTVLQGQLNDLSERFNILSVDEQHIEQAKNLKPISCIVGLGQHRLLFENVPPTELAMLGTVTKPSLADIFIAKQQEAL